MFMNGEDQDQLQLRETVGFMVYGLLEILRTVLN